MLLLLQSLSGCSNTSSATHLVKLDTSLVDKSSLIEHLSVISSDRLEGRKIGTKGNIETQRYLRDKLIEIEVQPFKSHFLHQFNSGKSKNKLGVNIAAVIPGREKSSKYIVLTAHYDHLGRKGRRIFNGTDDNASGTAALLSLASKIAIEPLAVSVLVLFTDGEENNLSGSKAFVKQNSALIENVILNINLDMISGVRSTKALHFISRRLEQISTNSKESLSLVSVEEAKFRVKRGFNQERTSGINKRTNWNMASDHGAFHQAKIPFIYYGVGTHENYHSENDNYENANLEFFHKSVNFVYMQLKHIDMQLLL